MTQTRSGAGNQQNQPPPPPPANQEQFFAQFLGELCNVSRNTGQASGGRNNDGGMDNHFAYKEFKATEPPKFTEAKEPMAAEEWLSSVEEKFRLVNLTETQKAEFGAHLLEGPAGIWWRNHHATFPPQVPITWFQFTAAFHDAYIPLGAMAKKLGEFIKLEQENKTMTDYLYAFNDLSR
jgi:hypothetical protein